MAVSRFPCFECGEPFDDVAQRAIHYMVLGHGFEQVQADAIDRARWGVMGEDAPDPVDVYAAKPADPSHGAVRQRRRATTLRVIQGGKL